MSYAPFTCAGCTKAGREVAECRIRVYQFSPHGRKCAREEPEKPKVIAEAGGDQYLEIPLELIYWREPIRKAIREEDVQNIAMSFTCHGQIEPIVVKPPNEEGMYDGVVGRLRYEGMRFRHGKTILARVHRFKSAREVREWQLAENLHRRDLTAIERAEAYRELYESLKEEFGGVKDKHIVSTIAKSLEELTGEKQAERSIRKYIQVSKDLPEEVKKTVTNDHFGIAHAEQLLRLKNMPKKQLELAEELVSEPMSVQQLKRKVDEISSPPKPKGLTFTCFFCGSKLGEEKIAEKIKEAEADPALYSVVKEQYREVFEIREQPE